MFDQVVQGRGGLVPFLVSALPERARISCARRVLPAGEALAAGCGLGVLLGLLLGPAGAQETRAARPSQEKPRLPEGLNFAHALFRQRRFDLAADEYRRFLDSGPTAAECRRRSLRPGKRTTLPGPVQGGEGAFQEFLDKNSDSPRAKTAWYRLGELAYMLGDLPAARKRWRRLFKGRPSILTSRPPGRIWETFAWAWRICPLPGSAYERSLADFPKGQLANRSRFGLGRTLADLGEIDLAIKRFSELAGQGSSDWTDRALLQLGKTQLAGGRYDPAVKTLESLDRLRPQRTEGRGTSGPGRGPGAAGSHGRGGDTAQTPG